MRLVFVFATRFVLSLPVPVAQTSTARPSINRSRLSWRDFSRAVPNTSRWSMVGWGARGCLLSPVADMVGYTPWAAMGRSNFGGCIASKRVKLLSFAYFRTIIS
jgi:hypothetical protein